MSSTSQALPTQNIGLVRVATDKAVLQEIPIPDLYDDYLLVRTVAVALNPTDWTTLAAPGDNGTIVGCDYAGVVEAVGKNVKRNFEVGERVAGFAHGANDANPQHGGFARYIIVKGDLQLRIPDAISFEEACAVGIGFGTAGFGLFKELGLALPGAVKNAEQPGTVLIYGGSTATGTLAIQLAKLAGLKVITTASPKNFDLVKDRGADLVFDYRDPEVGSKIRAATDDKLTKVFDTVSMESTAKICAEAISSTGGEYLNLLGEHDCPRQDVKTLFFLLYSTSGEYHIFEGKEFEAKPEDFAFSSKFAALADRLWAKGKWRAHPRRIMPGGLNAINDGMEEMRQGRVSGEKLVYRIAETVWE